MTSHHGPLPSPAESETLNPPPLCFCTASAGLNDGASLFCPLPESPIRPRATGLPPCAPATPTARSLNCTCTPPETEPGAIAPYKCTATDPRDNPRLSSGPLPFP